MPESELAALTRLIDELNESTSELVDRSAEQTKVQVELRGELAAVKKKLPEFVPKKRFRWMVALVILVVGAAVAIGLVFRIQDDREAEQRRVAIERDDEQDRQSSIRGCERANDVRATLRQIIELAVATRPPPPDLPEELAELYRQSQANTTALRERLLRLEGVQTIDCEAQYPAAAAREKA